MSLQIENKPGLWRAGRLRVPRAGARTAVVVAMALSAIAVQAPQALASGGSHAGGALAQVSAKGRDSGLVARRAFTVATPWNQYGRVPSHTHANPFENVLGPGNVSGLTQAWHYPTSGPVYSSPAVVNGVVYIGSYDHNVYALRAATGAKLWSHRTAGAIMSSPAVARGVVYVGSGNNPYALNA